MAFTSSLGLQLCNYVRQRVNQWVDLHISQVWQQVRPSLTAYFVSNDFYIGQCVVKFPGLYFF